MKENGLVRFSSNGTSSFYSKVKGEICEDGNYFIVSLIYSDFIYSIILIVIS